MTDAPHRAQPAQPIVRFRVGVLGPLEVWRDDAPLDAARWRRRAAGLLLLLATGTGLRRSRDDLIDAFWPDASPRAGASNLRYAVHLLRAQLGGADPIPVLSERGGVALNSAYAWDVDLARFEELIAAAGDADDAHAADGLRRAAALYRGEPLPEARYEDWAAPLRDRVEREWRAVCLRLGRLDRRRGDAGAALGWLERALDGNPLDEEALAELLRALIEAGRAPDALRRYQGYAARLRAEMGVAPGAAVRALVAHLRDAPADADGPPGADAGPGLPAVIVVPGYPPAAEGALVGREAIVRALLDTRVPEGDAAGDRLLLLAGEAGIGKTRLLAEAARRARERGMLTLAGGCYEQEGRLPYGPLHDALLDYVRAQSGPALRARWHDLLAELVRIVPEVRARLGGAGEAPHEAPRDAGEDQRPRLFAAVAQALERMAGERGLVLLLDDLQWADGATLQLLHYLARQPRLGRMLVVGAYRADEVSLDTPLAELVAGARQGRGDARLIEIIPLVPLAEAETGALVRDRLGGACSAPLRAAIHRASGGNPFFALQILALLREERRLEWVAREWRLSGDAAIELPPSVRQTVARRLRGLGAAERDLLRIGAALGREFGCAALRALWERDEDELWRALDGALDARLLHEAGDGYDFPQPVLREVVYGGIPAHRRRPLHRRAGEALRAIYGERHMEHAAELAWHFARADDPERALLYAVAAGDRAAQAYTYDEAERQYRAALDLARRQPPGTRPEAELLLKLGMLLRLTARREEAVALLEGAVRLADELGDPVLAGLALATLAKAYLRWASRDEAQATLARVAALDGAIAATAPSRDLALLHGELGNLYFRTGRYADSLAARERAMEAARALGDERMLIHAQVGRAVALAMLGNPREAGATARELLPRAEASGDRETVRLALAQVAESALLAGEFAQSRIHRERELEVAERMSALTLTPFTLSNLAQLLTYMGEWEAARRHAERALDELRAVGSLSRASYPLAFLGELALRQGDEEGAARRLEEGRDLAERVGDAQALRYVQRLLAERDVLAGRPEAAVARLDPLLDRPGLREHDVTHLLPTLAWARLALGDPARAAQVARAALARAAAEGNALATLDALRVRGMILARQRRWDEADAALRQAARLARGMPYPFMEARALAERGLALAERGRAPEAGESLERAAALFRRLGARRDLQRILAPIAPLG